MQASLKAVSYPRLSIIYIYTADLPQSINTTQTTFADDTATISNNSEIATAVNKLQDQLRDWFTLWKSKINLNKSTHITFPVRPKTAKTIPPVYINNQIIPMNKSVKYLGLIFDQRLTWADHIKAKRTSLNLKIYKLRPLLRSKTSLTNKILISKQILRPVMTYGIQLWGTSKNSNLIKFQASINNTTCPLQCTLICQQPHPTPQPQLTTNILSYLSSL